MAEEKKVIQLKGADICYPVCVTHHFNHLVPFLSALSVQDVKIMIITDTTVGTLYAQELVDLLSSCYEIDLEILPDGEQIKQLDTVTRLYQRLSEQGYDRSDVLLAFGGGVIGDIVGFVASTYLRGIRYVHVPTSLVAQVDSSIGGKTGVNTSFGKNLVGSFYHPIGIYTNISVLNTLSPRFFSEGMAEVIKTAAIGSEALWDQLRSLQDRNAFIPQANTIISSCIDIKGRIVMEDRYDQGIRLLLNFGHTLGHAIETVAGYGKLAHGEAVAIGMYYMSMFGQQQGWVEASFIDQLVELLKKFDLPIVWPQDLSKEKVIQAMRYDKKRIDESIRCIFVATPGQGKIRSVSLDTLANYLQTI